MKHSRLRIVILSGTLILAALITVQTFWFAKAFDITEIQFNHAVNLSLNAVALDVAIEAGVPIEVKNLSNNFYFVPLNASVNYEHLNQLIQKEFKARHLDLPYEIGVYSSYRDTLVYGNSIAATSSIGEPLSSNLPIQSNEAVNFAVYFPNKMTYMAGELQIWIFSTITLLLMVGFFAFAIVSLLKEKRYADIKNDFISNVTHEFKTPVTNIKIAHEVLMNHPDDPMAYLQIIDKANHKIEDNIDKVLQAATQDYKSTLKLEAIDLHEIIKECAENFQLRVTHRQGNISLQLNATNKTILGDREYILQAFSNLIDNAEKYSINSPSINITTESSSNKVILSIQDKGIGISKAFQSKVFDQFFRIKTGNEHSIKGFGLGLNVVKSIIKSHNGQIALHSELNRGTEITISLPIA